MTEILGWGLIAATVVAIAASMYLEVQLRADPSFRAPGKPRSYFFLRLDVYDEDNYTREGRHRLDVLFFCRLIPMLTGPLGVILLIRSCHGFIR